MTRDGTDVVVEVVDPRLGGDAVVATADVAALGASLELARHAPIETAHARTTTPATFLCTPSSVARTPAPR